CPGRVHDDTAELTVDGFNLARHFLRLCALRVASSLLSDSVCLFDSYLSVLQGLKEVRPFLLNQFGFTNCFPRDADCLCSDADCFSRLLIITCTNICTSQVTALALPTT